MSFGLTKTPTAFIDLVNGVSKNYLDKFVIIFINNILVYSRNLKEEHELYFKIVLEKLKEKKMFAKLSKCEPWLEREFSLGT